MTFEDLFSRTTQECIRIHTGDTYYHACLEWLHSQDVRWNSGDSLANSRYHLNKRAKYGDKECLNIWIDKTLTHGPMNAFEQVFEYEEIFPVETHEFDDIDSVLMT